MIAAEQNGTDKERSFKAFRRRILLRDSLTFSILLLIAAALFAITFFLFRSFQSHRDDLGKRWAQRGEQSLAQHRPQEAVVSLRAALAYAPDDVDYQLLLAQALADSGHTEEANAYYLNRREAAPGDGFVNLQLARLARQKGNAQQAVDYYRAAIFGDWGANGASKRRVVRMELSDYLIQRHDLAAARDELLIGASNAPPGVQADLLYGDRLQAAGDLPNALKYYNKAVTANPHASEPLEKAGRAAFALGEYRQARALLDRALRALKSSGKEAANASEAVRADQIEGLALRADRMQELDLSRELSAHDRAAHLQVAALIAQKRLSACLAHVQGTTSASAKALTAQQSAAQTSVADPRSAAAAVPSDLAALEARWRTAGSPAVRRALLSDAGIQDNMTHLIFDTELITAGTCGAPAGDDALLLTMASDSGSAADEGKTQ